MGKVVRAVAILAISAAIAVYAPELGLGILHAFGSTAVAGSFAAYAAGAVVSAALTIGAMAALQAISAPPDEDPSGFRRQYFEMDPSGFRHVEVAAPASVEIDMDPIEPRSFLRWHLFPWQRFGLERFKLDCMNGVLGNAGGGWGVIDRRAVIRPGDVFSFHLDDMWTSYWPDAPLLLRLTACGMGKRYLGVDPTRDVIIFDCTNPPTLCESGRHHFVHAYRVRAWSPAWWGALCAWWTMRRDDSAYQDRLGR